MSRAPVPPLLVAALALALAACGPEVRAFDLAGPAAPVELLPVAGRVLRVVWTYDADGADDVDVVIEAVASRTSHVLVTAPLVAGEASYVYPATSGMMPGADVIPAGVYQARAHAVRAGGGEELAVATAPGLVFVQGITFRDPELTFTSDPAARDIWMQTVTASVARATLVLTAPGQRYVISAGTIASDLAPVGRVVTFTGRTVDDVAIPAGDYPLTVEISAQADAVRYQLPGPTIHWRP